STTTAATAYSCTLEQTPPPTPAVLGTLVLAPFAFPSKSASFYFSDDEAGVSFLCSLDGSTFAACSSPKSYSGLSQGSHTFRVEAVDAAGNVSAPRSWTWTVDTVDPARPVFTQTPPNPSSTATSTFAWTDSSPDVALYLCSKENGTFLPCSSPLTYAVQTTSSGQHQFAVMAVDWAGRTSPAASYTWKVGAGSPQDFTISGSVTNLQLGVPKVVPVTLTNPNNLPIYVTSLTFAVSTNAGSGGCAASNFSVTQSDASAGTPITVPANGSVTLTTAPRAPRLTLLNLPVNQDVCKNKSFALSHTGSAHS
ncbi:MAG: OmpA protein, partial [Solirubrobacterales bacterium]|nr:OmpA protein [Solirubrobacterales bacterium]